MAKSNILTEYFNTDGHLVTVYKTRKPRQSEKTWHGAVKYTVSNMGRKATGLRDLGYSKASRGG